MDFTHVDYTLQLYWVWLVLLHSFLHLKFKKNYENQASGWEDIIINRLLKLLRWPPLHAYIYLLRQAGTWMSCSQAGRLSVSSALGKPVAKGLTWSTQQVASQPNFFKLCIRSWGVNLIPIK